MLLDRADAVMPRELHEVLDPYLNKLEQELDPTPQAGPPADPRPPSGRVAGEASRIRRSDSMRRRAAERRSVQARTGFVRSQIASLPAVIPGPKPNIRNIIGRWGGRRIRRFRIP